jgi:UDPglucose 6-dehydrogenase
MDLKKIKRLMRKPVLCDLRNLYDAEDVEAAGLTHIGVGRGRPAAAKSRKAPKTARVAKRGRR